jgi:geranylgeranyl diphosphate synthase type I
VGDAVLEIGQELLLSAEFEDKLVRRATLKMLRGITNTAWGQAYDITLEKIIEKCTEDDVITVHKAKTAIYTYENPLHIGAILAGLGDDVLKVLTEYSMDGGVAFQLQDDILGIFGDPEKTGKSANSDLLQGKVTLLILRTLKDGTPEQIEALKKVWGKRKADNTDIENAKKAIVDCGSLQYSRDISRSYAQKAAEAAEKLKGLNLNSEAIDFIQGVALYMVNRDV